MFDVGSVFTWKKFPYFDDPNSIAKTRWFVYLGRMPITVSPVFVFLCTTTTQLSHYENGGDRYNNPHITYHAGDYGFEKDSVLDARWGFFDNITEDSFKQCIEDMEKRGQLPIHELQRIFPLFCNSGRIPRIILRDIRNSLINSGVSGLQKI